MSGLGIVMAPSSVCLMFALSLRHFQRRTLQVFHLPDFINQTEPFASFDSSFEGCQHPFGPYAGFGPLPLGLDFSALFSLWLCLWHSQQVVKLRAHDSHGSTFLPPLAPRSLPASSLLWGL